MTEQASCAHLKVSFRTERAPYDGPVIHDSSGKHPPLKPGTMMTRGWWECDYGCGAKFWPVTVLETGIDSIREYSKLANVTLADRVRASEMLTVLNAATGIASEAGEINEIVKKRFFHFHPETEEVRQHMKRELGDLAWYWALMCNVYGFDPAEVLLVNIEKLKARYPEGFSTERSLNRAAGDV